MVPTPPLEWLAARAILASGVASELAGPLEAVHEKLERTVERLDRHVATARGPEPLPYKEVSELRERVADVFLAIGRVRQLASNLAALAEPPARRPVDLNDLVERALSLARHRLGPESEVLLDLASLPLVLCDPASLAQALALLLVHAAQTAAPGGTVVVKTEAPPGALRLRVEAPRDGAEVALPFGDAIRAAVEAEGGRLVVAGERGGLVLEVVLPRSDALR